MVLKISLGGSTSSMFRRTSEIPKSPMTTGTRPDPVQEGQNAEGEPRSPDDGVQARSCPGEGRRQAIIRALIMEPVGQEGEDRQAQDHQGEILRRPEAQGELGQRRSHEASGR